MSRLSLLPFIVSCAFATAVAAPPITIDPLPSAPYSASATIPPHAVRAFTGTYTADGPDLTAQARAALEELENDLIAAGLAMEDVINVRGYLKVPEPDPEAMAGAMAAWNAAFSPAFAGRTYPPTRTTLGVTTLADPDALVAVEAVVAAHGDLYEWNSARSANARVVQTRGPVAPVTTVAPFTSMLFTSGMLADPLEPDGTDYGTMAQQTASTLGKLEDALRTWGLTPYDIVYVRALLSPVAGDDTQTVDFVGYEEAYAAYWDGLGMDPPPTGVLAAPGFNAIDRHVEIEVYAAFPDAASHVFAGGNAGALSVREGSETSFLNRTVVTARDATLVWFAGAIDMGRDDHEGQGVETLLNLRDRMNRVGVTFENVVQLRAYLHIINDFRTDFGSWNRAYQRFFDHGALNPEKPIRTAFPVSMLPGPSLIEIEILGVK